jgi:hypothetical protein
MDHHESTRSEPVSYNPETYQRLFTLAKILKALDHLSCKLGSPNIKGVSAQPCAAIIFILHIFQLTMPSLT